MPSNNLVTTLPTVQRRLISMVYEFLLAFAVLFLPFLIFEMLTGASHAPLIEHLRQALAFVILGIYFVHQWSREGQTLAMRTWRLKLVHPGHDRVAPRVAALRYLLCWLWVSRSLAWLACWYCSRSMRLVRSACSDSSSRC